MSSLSLSRPRRNIRAGKITSLEKLDHAFLVPNLFHLPGKIRIEAAVEPVVHVVLLIVHVGGELFRGELLQLCKELGLGFHIGIFTRLVRTQDVQATG